MKGESSRQTGDVNLSAALMACAIPLSKACPVKIIDSDGYRPYASFSVDGYSADGKNVTEKLMTYWSTGAGIESSHPFARICEFINGKPSHRMTSNEWLDYAVSYLSSQGVRLPGLRRLSDIADYVAKVPSLSESYILAFVANRAVCLDLYHDAKRSVFMSRDQSHALIDTKLPAWQRNELLSRLQG